MYLETQQKVLYTSAIYPHANTRRGRPMPIHSQPVETREVPIEIFGVINEYGRLPTRSELDELRTQNVDREVIDAIETIRQYEEDVDITVEELLLNIKRMRTVFDRVPTKDDIDNWDSQYGLATYDSVFGSVDTAIQLAVVSDTNKLQLLLEDKVKKKIKE